MRDVTVCFSLVLNISSSILVCSCGKLLGDVGTSFFFFPFGLVPILFADFDTGTGAGSAVIAVLDAVEKLKVVIKRLEEEEGFEAVIVRKPGQYIDPGLCINHPSLYLVKVCSTVKVRGKWPLMHDRCLQ